MIDIVLIVNYEIYIAFESNYKYQKACWYVLIKFPICKQPEDSTIQYWNVLDLRQNQ